MKQVLAFLKSIQLLGFLVLLLGMTVLLILLTFSSLNRINAHLENMQQDIRWRLALGEVEDAWLEQGLLLRRGMLDPANLPADQAVTDANQAWESQIMKLRSLTTNQDDIDYLVSLPPIGRTAFTEAIHQADSGFRQTALDRAFSTNQGIDHLLEDQAFSADSKLRSDQTELERLVVEYNGIGLIGLSLFALVGIWVLFWASRLPQPLLAIRVALAATAGGNYQPQALDKIIARRDAFGELALSIHHAAEHLQNEEQVLQAEIQQLRKQVDSLRRSRIGSETVTQEQTNG